MGKTVDDKVVAMSFEHSKFESGVAAVLRSLDKLKAALHFPRAGKGLEDINAAGRKIDLSHIASGIDGIKSKFSAMSVVALSVLANVANRAVTAGAQLVKSLTFEPIMGGFKEYETNLNSVQTILANTAASGATLDDVNAALLELNHYSDQTIYNFSEMAKNIGTFTAAGVDLDLATASIKGIANLAAVSGSNSQQASTAMYQLSQAIAAGRVSLQDWNSVVNAGMGGTVFQRALANTAENMGTLNKGAVELKGKMKNVSIEGESFRESIMARPGKESWLTSEVLTKTLEQFTGDLSDAELAAQGFSKAQIKAIQDQAQMAVKAATEVKTLSGVIDTAKESAGSGWAQTWQIIFGDFGEAKTLFTGVSTAINGFIGASAEARNKVLGDWKELGGRTLLIEGIKDAFGALGAIIAPIKDAFRDIFPAKTGQDLFNLTQRFANFTKSLAPAPKTVENLRRTFRGFFALLSIGKQVISGIFTVIGTLLGTIGKGSGGFLEFTGNLGDNLTALNAWLKEGDRLENFFERVGAVMAQPIALLGKLKDRFTEFWDSLDIGEIEGVRQGLGDMTKSLTPMEKVLKAASRGWEGLIDLLQRAKTALAPVASAIGEAFAGVGTAIKETFQGASFDQILDVIQTGLLGGLVLTIKRFLSKDLPGAGLLDSITGTFDALTGKLTAMQQNVQADTLQKIAIAVGVLTVSVVALSMIKPDKLSKALTAMAVGIGQLVGAMALLSMIPTAGFLRIPFIAGSLILLATAVGILTASVKVLSTMSWGELSKGLLGVAVLLGAISLASIPLSANASGMIRAGIGIAAIAVAMKILASAVKDFGSMSWGEIGKGLGAVAVALVGIGMAAKVFPKGMVAIGVGLIAVSVGLKLLGSAVQTFGEMDLTTLGVGMGAIAISLGLIAAAMILMPPTMPLTAAGLLLVAAALMGVSKVVQSFGGLSIEEIAKGLGTLAGALIILAAAMIAMTGTLPGAAALVVAAGAIALLAPAIESLGGMSWGGIIKGMVALAAALTIMGVASVLLAPVAPALLAMGAALLLIGGGLALAGAGVFLLGTGLSAIAIAGPAAIAILIASLIDLVEAIPRVAESFIMGFLRIVQMLAEVAPKFTVAIGAIIIALVDAIIIAAPKLAEAFLALVQAALTVLREAAPDMVDTGIAMLGALLAGLEKNIGRLTASAMRVLAAFLTAVANNLSRVQRAGADLIVKFIAGIGQNISRIVSAGGDVIAGLIRGISNAQSKIITAATNLITRFITSIGNAAGRIIATGASMITRLLEGINNSAGRLISKAVEVAGKFVQNVAKGLVRLTDEGATAIINFLNGVAGVIRSRGPEMTAAGRNIASAIIQGFVSGINAGDVVSAVISKFRAAVAAGKRAVGAKSPSTEFIKIGEYVVQGFAIGLQNSTAAEDAVANMANGIIETTKAVLQITSPSKVFKEIGEYVNEGFVEGLLGSADDIETAFETIEDKLTEAMALQRDAIRENEKKLSDLRKKDKKDADAIKKAEKALKASNALYKQAKDARSVAMAGMKKEQIELQALSIAYADISAQLDEATKNLESAKKARDDFAADTASDFSKLPDIDEEAEDQVGTFTNALAEQVAATQKYQATLAQLRAMGLDDATYRMLLDEGTAGQKFADQLLAGGPSAIGAINALNSQLQTAANTLGSQAAISMYQAGVDTAQGIVNGLAAKKGEIAKAMEDIATAMINAIKKKLKIKSPSQVFQEFGTLTMEGMAKGLDDSAVLVSDSVENAAQSAIDAMSNSMASMSSIVADTLEVDPTITPVLDLSQIKKDADSMSSLLNNVTPITAASSYGQAATISAERNRMLMSGNTGTVETAASIVFQQTNTSPKALSDVEIFRQTKNLLAQAKEAIA